MVVTYVILEYASVALMLTLKLTLNSHWNSVRITPWHFLDGMIFVNNDSTLMAQAYRKPTHTDDFLQSDSFHPHIHKILVMRTLQCRADTVFSKPALAHEEEGHIDQQIPWELWILGLCKS